MNVQLKPGTESTLQGETSDKSPNHARHYMKAQFSILEWLGENVDTNLHATGRVDILYLWFRRIISSELHRKRNGELRKLKNVSEAKLIRDIDTAKDN